MSSSCCAGSGAGGRRAVHTNPLHALTGGLPFQKHTKPNTVTDDPKHPVAKYPVREVYTNQPLQKNATRVKLFLAFDCAKFKTDNAKAWLELVAGLTEENVATRKQSDKDLWKQCKEQVARQGSARLVAAAAATTTVTGLGSSVASLGAYGGSTYCAGISAAKLRLESLGKAFAHVKSLSAAEVEEINQLLLRWMCAKAVPLDAVECEEFDDFVESLNAAMRGRTLTGDKVRRENRLKHLYLAIEQAVKELEDKHAFYSIQIDGWTSPTHEYIMQAIKLIAGTPFFATQPTSQGEKCDAKWTIKQLEDLIKDPRCVGVTADNCGVMQDFKAEFMQLAYKLKQVKFYANCLWHGVDSIGGALLGLGGEATQRFVLEITTGPAAMQWTADCKKKGSIPAVCKEIVNTIMGAQRLRGVFVELVSDKYKVALTNWRDADEAAKRDKVDRPPRPLRLPALAKAGTTRKLSEIKPMATVYVNRHVLDQFVRSKELSLYLEDQRPAKRAELKELADIIKDGVLLNRAGVLAAFLGILQTLQRMLEYDNTNLSDGLHHFVEAIARINGFTSDMITPELKERALKACEHRLMKLWTSNFALAYMLDPRTGFGATKLSLSPVCSDLAKDGEACLKQRIAVLPDDVQNDSLRFWTKLTSGRAFDFVSRDKRAHAAASDMPTAEWWARFCGVEGARMSQYIAQPLFTLSVAQAGVERVNSSNKHVVEGRWRLKTENQRMLAAIYVNGRQLRAARDKEFATPEPGSYKLLRHWPPRESKLMDAVIDDIRQELEAQSAAPTSVLHEVLEQLGNADEADELRLCQTGGAASALADAAAAVAGCAVAGKGKKRKATHDPILTGRDGGSTDSDGSGSGGADSDSGSGDSGGSE